MALGLQYPLNEIANYLHEQGVEYRCPLVLNGNPYIYVPFPNHEDPNREFRAKIRLKDDGGGALSFAIRASIEIPTYLVQEIADLCGFKALNDHNAPYSILALRRGGFILFSETLCPIAEFKGNWKRAGFLLFAVTLAKGQTLLTLRQCAQYNFEKNMCSTDDKDGKTGHLSSSSH